MTQPQHFNPITTPLTKGVNLLEASAGTGKTYAIAMLALRFIVEQGLEVDQLLIVTFTKAATKELKARVRARLVEGKRCFLGESEGIDDNVQQWASDLLKTGEIKREIATARLNEALLSIDKAGIFTIHGFCQRLLKEHALESGQMFDVELSDEVHTVRKQIVDDFWRCTVYPREPWQLGLLCHDYATPDALVRSLGSLSNNLKIVPELVELDDLDTLLTDIKIMSLTAQVSLLNQSSELIECVQAGYFKKTFTNKFDDVFSDVSGWLAEMVLENHDVVRTRPKDEFLDYFTTQGLEQNILKKYTGRLNFNTDIFDRLYTKIQQVSLVLRRLLAAELQVNLDIRLQQLNLMSHDSLITRTEEALRGDSGERLIAALVAQYQVALIDEFQDTDQLQWTIFSSLFADDTQSLYLIGDPKQAIYKFRGADIHSYLLAKETAQFEYTLSNNWRSNPNLVHAINVLFEGEKNPFLFKGLEFHPAKGALSSEQGALYLDGIPLKPLALWQLAESDSKHGYWDTRKKDAENELNVAITQEILQLLTTNVTIRCDGKSKPLKPADIAILVRTNQQAKIFQNVLLGVGILAVLNSTESVFSQHEASDLYRLMQCIAYPSDVGLLKQALTLSWFGLNGQQLNDTLNNELQLGAWLGRVHEYHVLWQEKGFMTMMWHLLDQENVCVNLAVLKQAERSITNLYHVLELVQQESLEEHLSLYKTIDWLSNKIELALAKLGSSDAQQLRLESDAEAVKIVTMHRSKGLEYPVVFCPYLWERKNKLATEKHLISCHTDEEMIVDLGSINFEKHRQIALIEELAEDVRILYVAVTRAKYRCYLPWVNQRTEKIPNQSAFAKLLHNKREEFSDLSFDKQQNTFKKIVSEHPESFCYQLIATGQQLSGDYKPVDNSVQLSAPIQKRPLYSAWEMSSFTALSSLSHQQNSHELPLDRAEEEHDDATLNVEQTSTALAKGAATGNMLHELLEYCKFSLLASRREAISDEHYARYRGQRDAACQRYSVKPSKPEIIDTLLYQVTNTPLSLDDPYFCLANINEKACMKEMPFYLTVSNSHFSTTKINTLLKNVPSYQALSHKQMQGFLTGFIDLICEYQGRYYVIDYKSNALQDYQAQTLINAMHEHNYGLQYWLYSLVLHSYLQERLENYDFYTHFGGVRYLFLRGMQAEKSMSGVFSDDLDLAILEKLSAVFRG